MPNDPKAPNDEDVGVWAAVAEPPKMLDVGAELPPKPPKTDDVGAEGRAGWLAAVLEPKGLLPKTFEAGAPNAELGVAAGAPKRPVVFCACGAKDCPNASITVNKCASVTDYLSQKHFR